MTMCMSTTSKSPRKVLLAAYATAMKQLPAYAHLCSPRKYTQPQLFFCLVFKVHQKKDYRGIVAVFEDDPSLRAAIGMKAVPHDITLQRPAHVCWHRAGMA